MHKHDHSVRTLTQRLLATCSTLIVLLTPSFSSPAAEMDPGTVDVAFNAGWSLGRVVRALARQPDSKIVVGTGDGIYRLNADGSLDSSFNSGLVATDGDVHAVVLQPDGRILVGGRFRNVNGTPRGGIARIHPDGSLDGSFQGVSSGADGRVHGIALQADGRMVVGGNFTNFNGSVRNHITRLNADGTLDNTFTASLVLLFPEGDGVNAIVRQSDGKFLIGGGFTSVNGTTRNYIARLNADGALDTTFLNGLSGASDVVKAVVLPPDGKVLIGGNFTGVNGVSRNRIARLNSNGSLDTAFANGLSFAFQEGVDAVAQQGDGKVIVGGGWYGPPDAIARLNTNGTLDATFSSFVTRDNLTTNSPVLAILVQPEDGKIFVGGSLLGVNAAQSKRLARLEANGGIDSSFDVSTRGINGVIHAAALHTGGRILVGGEFSSVSGVPRGRFARLNGNGMLDTSFPDTLADGSVNAMAVYADGRVLIAGNFRRIHGIDRVSIARLNADGTLDAGFLNNLAGVPGGVNTIALQADGKVVIAGFFRFVNSIARTFVARLNADGTLDTGFGSIFRFNGSVHTLASRPDSRVLVGGSVDLTNGMSRYLVGLTASGAQDSSFLNGLFGPDWYVHDIELQPDGRIIVGGNFGGVNGVARAGLARLNANGSVDPSLSNSPPVTSQVIALQPDGKLLVGGPFAYVDGFGRSRVARLLLDGAVDTNFFSTSRGTDFSPVSETYHRPLKSLAVQPDGKILVAGDFTHFEGTPRSYIVRLHGASVYRPGQEIVRPPNAPLTNNMSSSGPVVSPSGLGYWDAASFTLYAGNTGSTNPMTVFVTWKDAANNDVRVPVVLVGIAGQEYALGDEILPPAGADVTRLSAIGPEVQPPTAAFWHNPSRKLYAADAGPFTVVWRNSGNAPIPMQAVNLWPTNESFFQAHVAGTPPVQLDQGGGFGNARLLSQTAGVGGDALDVQNARRFSASGAGRALLLLSPGNPQESSIYFQFVKIIRWDDPAHLATTNATVGDAIVPPAVHDAAAGAPWVANPLSRYCAQPGYWAATNRLAPIIPVNTDSAAAASDDLGVVYYQRGARLMEPATRNMIATSIGWAFQPMRYQVSWPTNAPLITIASSQGTGTLNTNEFRDWKLYAQNDRQVAGFNPNDEHAVVQQAQGGLGLAAFPLRDDLGTPETSEPHVLITYFDGLDANRPKLKVFRVQTGTFQYNGTAGNLMQRPYPLTLFQRCEESHGFSGPYWRDRKLDFWARAAGNNGGATNIVMRWFYPTQPGFYFPSNYFAYFPAGVAPTNTPPAGTRVPWLDLRAGTPRTPIDATYTISWPVVPELSVGETLVKPKFGLPDVSLQTSVEVIYQQSVANGGGESVALIDPTRTIEVTNVLGVASDVATVQAAGLTWFPALPPHLRARLWYEDARKALRFKGYFLEPPAGEYHLLLNVITERERQQLLQLSQDSVFRGHINALAARAAQAIEVPPNTPFDSLALTAGLAEGSGYVTLAFGNSTNLTPAAEPVSLEIIRVRCPIYRGELKVIESDGPFDEKLTLRHSGDFAGRPDDYIFEWRTLPPGPDGLPQIGIPFEQWPVFTPLPASGEGALDITIEGPGLFTLSDNYFVCRYRPRTAGPCSTVFGDWTAPQLAEGWIKRVVGRINPFTQRAEGGGLEGAEERFGAFNKEVNTIVSMISQAGTRFEGSIPFNADAVDSFGLIEIYETVLKRGINLSVSGNPPIDYGPANDALLLAAGRLSDLYMLLGNEAYADASDPTIAYGTDSGVYGAEASTIHCFQNQTATLLEEELALLRGRDDTLQPGVKTAPFYNRLVWNFTGGDGEVAYAANYDIRDQTGAVDGVLNEADAKQLYPQAHGDAWGHYLTAIKGYYYLLHNPFFTWVPRTEAVLVGGVPVQVDYMDERKFARAAAARAQTGVETLSLTYRERFVEDPAGQWQGYLDSRTNRAWGVAEWGSRAGQGAFFDWAVASALLPPTNSNAGIQKIDRTTVTELRDIASAYHSIQEQVDKADSGLNPLGLTKNTIPFDIDPVQISQGRTHFEQIYDRAVGAMNNTIAVFNHANNSSQALRRQADSIAEFQQNVTDREADFNNRLIEVFGYPYPDDIGPTGTYPSGYNGPDIYHYMYVDRSALIGEPVSAFTEYTVTFSDLTVRTNGTLSTVSTPVKFHLANNGLGFVKPPNWTLPRRAPGDIQRAHSDLLQAKARFERALVEYENLLSQIEDQAELLKAQHDLNAEEISILNSAQDRQERLNDKIQASRRNQINHRNNAELIKKLSEVAAEYLPKVLAGAGGSFDGMSVARGSILLGGALASAKQSQMYDGEVLAELDHQLTRDVVQSQANISLTTVRQELAELHQLKQLEQLVRHEAMLRLELFTIDEAMQQAAGNYMAALTRAQRFLEDRLRFRQQTAAQVQAYRYRDMAFRIFRNDALQKYRAQFDLAATYVYLAAKAYDFETNLRPGDPAQPGRAFLSQIVRARTIGKINNGMPEVGFNGDPGLADPMARMGANFAVLKSQLGFNNPQLTVREFSLRSQLLRVVPGSTSSGVWREALAGFRVANLSDVPEVRQHLLFEGTQPQEPGLVIPFASTVNQDLNFFGWPAGPGDSSFNPTAFSTKVKSISVSFLNYRTTGSGGMQASVYVYLVPVGSDIARTPRRFVGDTINFTREWRIVDQWLPVPFPLSGENDPALGSSSWIPVNYIQVGQQPLGEIRGHAAFEAWHDSQIFPITEPQFKATRLVGRSVWNDKWLLVIPGVSLFPSDRNEGLNRFVHGGLSGGVRDGNGVSDVRIRMEAYSYTGR